MLALLSAIHSFISFEKFVCAYACKLVCYCSPCVTHAHSSTMVYLCRAILRLCCLLPCGRKCSIPQLPITNPQKMLLYRITGEGGVLRE